MWGGESVLCFIVVLFQQTCVGITTRTVCVVAIGCYEWVCKLQMFPSQTTVCMPLTPHELCYSGELMNSGMCVLVIIFCSQDTLDSHTPLPQHSLCLSESSHCRLLHP